MITQPQPIPNAAQSSHIPTAKPRFGGYQDRVGAGKIGHNHSNRVFFSDKPPRRRSPAIAPSPSSSPVDGNVLSNTSVVTENETLNDLSKSASLRLDYEVHNPKRVTDLTVTLLCSGMSTPLLFSRVTSDTTESNQFHRLPIKVKNVVESKSDLTDFAVPYSKDITIFGNLRNLVLALESGSLKREDIYTDIVE